MCILKTSKYRWKKLKNTETNVDIPSSWTKRIKIVTIIWFPKIYRFNEIPIKIPLFLK
jgi:hypothetical protein